jgi:Ca2+-binding RTX toxin-like protein
VTGGSVGGSHVYTATGVYTVTLTVTDDDGGTTVVTKAVEIKAVEVQPDTTDPTRTQLVVGGTSGDDQIVLNPGGTGGTVQVIINDVVVGTFSPTGRIVVFGQAGNDNIQVASGVANTAWLYGDDGNDRLAGGSGNNVLLGGAGNDSVLGGQGRDLLIGGTGADRVRGNAADDILVGGFTIHDADEAALFGLVTEWSRTDITREERIHHLTNGGGLNGTYKLDATAVLDDGEADTLTGSSGIDWFFAGLGDSITDEHEDETF